MRCKSGLHEWTDPADAEKCCNGWHRETMVGTGADGVPWYGFAWVPGPSALIGRGVVAEAQRKP